MEALFRDVKAISFGKVATFKLPPDPSQWITEILKYFHEKYPWAGKYITSVELKEKKPEEGYGLGWVEVASTSDGKSSSVKIPVMIKDNELYPMDVIIDRKGRHYTMTPKRLDEALFRPDLFEKLVEPEELKDQSHVAPFSFDDRYPTQRQGYFGSGFFKQSLLNDIKETLIAEDIAGVAETLSKDDDLNKCALNNEAYYKCLEILYEAEKHTKTASVDYEDEIDPTVMQVVRLPRAQYLLKTANPRAYKPVKKILDRPTALAKLGEQIVGVVDRMGRMTVTSNTTLIKAAAEEEMPDVAAETGEYEVSTITGSPMKGIVFSTLVNPKGDEVPIRLFSGSGSGYAMQDEIMGRKTKGVVPKDIPSSPAKGFGVMFWQSGGKVKATEPVFVTGTGKDEATPVIDAHTAMGETVRLIPSPVKEATPSEGGLMIPAQAQFHALTGKSVPLAGTGEDVAKNASLKSRHRRVFIRSNGHGRFSFLGGCGIDKLSRDETTNIDFDDAIFLATSIGMSPEFAETKLAVAMRNPDGTTTSGLHTIVTVEEFEKQAEQKLLPHKDSLMSFMGSLRQNLVKEAVVLEDQDTIDKVLALNFINPDNIKVFVEYLPGLEEAQEKLNKLLLSSRIGLDELDEPALMNSIAGLEKTIQGLRILLHTQPDGSVS